MGSVDADTDVVMEDAANNAVASEQHAASTETTPEQHYIIDMDGVIGASTVGYHQDESMVEYDNATPEIESSPKSPPRERPDPIRTGLCYDDRMRLHATVDTSDVHPEDPRRIAVIYNALVQAGLVNQSEVVGREEEDSRFLFTIPARMAEKDEITLNHTSELYDFVKSTNLMDNNLLLTLSSESDSVYFSKYSFECASLSCGGAIETCVAVMRGKVKNAIAVIRPPGHHAERAHPQGFCFFNNACIAAQVVQKAFPHTCRKVLIMDWDVHHGNGTQNTFYKDPYVLYVSIHVHKDGKFYPQGGAGGYDRSGAEAGLGKNVNIPWPKHGMGDGDYIYAFQNVVIPIAYEYDPDLVIISAGFDAAEGDEIGMCNVSPTCYAHMTHMLMSLARGKVVALLEGGYNLDSIAKSALAVTRTLMGDPPERNVTNMPSRAGFETIQTVIRQQARYWYSLGGKQVQVPKKVKAERMHDVIRAYQSEMLYTKFKMTKLQIFRDRISRSYENQVLATPDMTGFPDPITKKLELHESWLDDDYDASKGKSRPGPRSRAAPELSWTNSSESKKRSVDVIKGSEEVCVYLWDNYLEYVVVLERMIKLSNRMQRVSDASSIIFLGVGHANYGILHLLNSRDCSERVKGVVQFIGDSPIKPVLRAVTDVPQWYFLNSYNLVASNHAVWDSYSTKKPKKKFGRLVKANSTMVNDMLRDHKNEVTHWICSQLGETAPPGSIEDVDVGSPKDILT
ncbi:hypothetical protein FGG08_003002 [Glutinoglossum americanum]|uniref:histone deacetylase n=1 Tax=Glutinoglossum americanum TaxID=1670608 RepID=A0A9P8IBV7_9PEZI|nr:hypothetical protein FGG08_003002 [Glutinoglossum americanum]